MRKYLPLVALLALIAFLCSVGYAFGWFSSWQEKLYDRFFVRIPAPQNMVIIGIDDESVAALGGWPLRRSTLASALSHLQGAAGVALDVALIDPSSFGAGDDAALASALARLQPPVILPVQFDERGGKTTASLPLLRSHTQEGFVNVQLDSDGIARRFEAKRQGVPSLSLALLSGAGLSPAPFPDDVRILYRGPSKTFLTIPFIDLYRGTIPASVLKGKLVLVGATAPDLHDYLETPFGALPGVEVHANALATLQEGAYFSTLPLPLVLALISLVCALAGALVVLLKRLPLLILALALVFLGLNAASAYLFGARVLVPDIALSLAFVLSAGGALAFQYLAESREKRRIRETFQYYLMPEVIEELVRSPEKLRLGGEKRRVAILFSDIRGFTTISEKLSPEELTHLINEYLTAMTDIIMDGRGLVDKYIGDAIMAFWGAPLPNPCSSADACRSAIAMARRLRELNVMWKARGVPTLGIGVGINSGDVIVGNMGSSKRFNYTIMGDEVNFGSRLEGLTKAYGVMCLVSESVTQEARGEEGIFFRPLDIVMVKGKKEPKKIFELIVDEMDNTLRAAIAAFVEGQELYIAGRWQEAIVRFDAALSLRDDGPSRTLRERCLSLLEHPPEEWTGVYEFKTK